MEMNSMNYFHKGDKEINRLSCWQIAKRFRDKIITLSQFEELKSNRCVGEIDTLDSSDNIVQFLVELTRKNKTFDCIELYVKIF